MILSKYDSANIKILNKKIILKLVHKFKPISRNDIARMTGLKASSVTRLVHELIKEGHVFESGVQATNSPGRRKVLLDVNPNYRVSLLLDIGVTDTELAIGFYDGTVKIYYSFRTPKSVEEFFGKVKAYYESLKKLYNISTVVFSVPGMVDLETNTVINAPNLGWRNVKITEHFKLELPVLADNEANLSVLGEKYHSKLLAKFSDVVFVIVREGVGTGIMIGNTLLRGKFFSAGEFGHMTVDLKSDKVCHCGKKGCWELYCSSRYAMERARAEIKEKKFKTFKELVACANDERVGRILQDMARNLGRGLVNIVNALNPQVIILGGVLANMPPPFYAEAIQVVRREALRPASEKVIIVPTMFKNISSNIVGANVYAIDYWIEHI